MRDNFADFTLLPEGFGLRIGLGSLVKRMAYCAVHLGGERFVARRGILFDAGGNSDTLAHHAASNNIDLSRFGLRRYVAPPQ